MSSFTLTPAPTPTSTLIPFNHNGRLLTLIPGKPLLYYALNKSRSPGPFRPGPPGEGEGDPDPNAESHVTFRSSSGSSEDCHSQEQGGQEEEPDWLDPPDDFDPIGYIDEDGQGHGKIDFGWALDGIPTYNPDTGNDNNLSDDSLKLVHEVIQINQGLGMNNFGTGLLWVGLFNKLPPISHEHHKVGYPISVERSFTSRNAGGSEISWEVYTTTITREHGKCRFIHRERYELNGGHHRVWRNSRRGNSRQAMRKATNMDSITNSVW